MAKFKAKDFLMQKGEKVVLGAALAGLGLLGVMGVTQLLSAESPAKKKLVFDEAKARIDKERERPDGPTDVKPLETPDLAMRPIDPRYFESKYLPFETVDTPSDKRDNPVVLGITDAQVDLVRAPIKAYDILKLDDGVIKIGILTQVKLSGLDTEKLKEIFTRQKGQLTRPRANPAPVPAPMAPPPPAVGPRGGDGMAGGGGAAVADGTRTEKTIKYVTLEEFDKEVAQPGVLPALAVYPTRMVVVHAAFPLKEQLEVIRRALRLKTLAEASAETATPPSPVGPTFLGFEVERRIVAPNGQVYDWAPYDHIAQYLDKIAIRKFADQPDDGLLSYFLRYEQMMAMPLPALAANLAVYPGVRLDAIVRGYKKMQDANKKPVTDSELKKKFEAKEGGNPFAPSTGAPGAGGVLNSFSGDAPATGVSPRGGPGDRPRPLPGVPAPGVPGAVDPSGLATTPNAELEHMLIRFLDVDIRPGFTYQYRIRVKMKNPNFGNKKVNRPDDAKTEVLWGPWVTIANEVNVPADRNLYAGDPVAYADRLRKDFKDRKVVELLDNNNGEKPVVQFQSWTEKVPIEAGKTEPAGYWVVSEVPVSRGEYVGRKQLVTLPMWSSEKVAFILQELPKYSVKGGGSDKPKGLMVDFTTPTMLVDYEGGKVRYKMGDKTIDDEADVEMMLLQPDGSVIVRNSGVDKANAERAKRDVEWRKWLDEIKSNTEKAGDLTQPNTPPGAGGRN
ncbi:hypothetical protein BH11PLA2_BH11PLA2_03640 [soil metagenome]